MILPATVAAVVDVGKASHLRSPGNRTSAATLGTQVRGLFAFLWLAAPLRRHLHDPGCSEMREDASSNRERVEGLSARLTPVQGVVRPSQQAHQPKAEQRVPFHTGAAPGDQSCNLCGLGLPSPGTLPPGT